MTVNGLTGNLGAAALSGTGSSLSLNGTNYVINQTVTIPAGATLTLNGSWNNASTITETNATLNLGGSFTQATLGTFSNTGGTVNITGTLSGGLALNATTGSWTLTSGATILGGTPSLSSSSHWMGRGPIPLRRNAGVWSN